jgi:hypothetical protein
MKLDFKTLAIIGLIIVVVLMRMCDGDKTKKDINGGDIVKVGGKKYEVVGSKRDTIYIVRDTTVYKEGKTIKVRVEVPKYIPQEADTQLILMDYFTKRFYTDTLDLGKNSYVIVEDTIIENKIFARKFNSKITERIINDTLFLKEPAKRQVYLGLTGGFDKVNILNYAGPSLLYKDKKDKIFGLGVGLNNSKQISLQGSIYWKIKLKK